MLSSDLLFGGGVLKFASAAFQAASASTSDQISYITDPSRDSILVAVQQQIKARDGILESYKRLKEALKQLQENYVSSKETINCIARYTAMKRMIREVVSLEKNYWILIDLPKQELSESQTDFLTRVLTAMEQRLQNKSTPVKGIGGISSLLGTAAHISERAKEITLYEQLKSKSTDELRKENAHLQTYLYKLIKKYMGLRSVLTQLTNEYSSSKVYPIVPRYSMLKTMIKNALRSPAFVEVCHESENA